MNAPRILVIEKGAGFEVTCGGVWIATVRDRGMAEVVRSALRVHFDASAAASIVSELGGVSSASSPDCSRARTARPPSSGLSLYPPKPDPLAVAATEERLARLRVGLGGSE